MKATNKPTTPESAFQYKLFIILSSSGALLLCEYTYW